MRIRGEARGKFILIIIITTTFLFCVVPTTAHVVPGQVVISEVCVRGVGSAVDEFVELYNPTDSEISLSGWKLQYKPATDGTWRSKVGDSLPADKKIESHKFLLLAGKLYAGDTMPDYRHNANWTLSDDAGHVRIIDAEGNEIDRVGYGKSADFPEGSPAPKPPEGKSIERKHLVYGYASCQDTNNNSLDFEKKTLTPMNSAFSMSPLPPPPDHIVISEVYPNAVNESGSEWIELYNPTDLEVNISGWWIDTKTYNQDAVLPSNAIIPGHGFYLIADKGFATGKDNFSWSDADYEEIITLTNENGWIHLNDSSDNNIDLIGWGSDSPEYETSPFVPDPDQGKSIERKSLYDGYAPCQDTNNNSEDFFVQDTPIPKNSSYSMSPTPPPAPNPGPPVAVPEFNATGLLALIGILSIVLAVTILASNRKRGI